MSELHLTPRPEMSLLITKQPQTPLPTTPQPSPLLALPAETRNQIYALLLTSAHIPALRTISTRGHVSDYILPALHLTPSLLRTCHQIHNEALGILYGSNTFAAHPSLLTSMPHLISPRAPILRGPGLGLIRRWYIHVRIDVDARFDAGQVKAAFSGAEALEVDVFQAVYGDCDLDVLRLFEGVRGVGTAVVGGSTGAREYAKWLERVMMEPVGSEVVPFGHGEW